MLLSKIKKGDYLFIKAIVLFPPLSFTIPYDMLKKKKERNAENLRLSLVLTVLPPNGKYVHLNKEPHWFAQIVKANRNYLNVLTSRRIYTSNKSPPFLIC